MSINELLNYIFENKSHFLSARFELWVKSSRTFRTFAETHRDKIRKKLRGIRDEDGLKDLDFELETAYLLLQERRFAVEYEKYAADGRGGPDFTVTFRTRVNFNVEASRIRPSDEQDSDNLMTYKLMNAVCEKLRQMPPSIINILVVTSPNLLTHDDMNQAMKDLAERQDTGFFLRRGFQNVKDFHRQFSRLSALIVRSKPKNVLWSNPAAKHTAPRELLTILENLSRIED